MSVKIYHNPRCKKSRAGLEYLEKKTGEFTKIEYLKTGLSEEEIREMLTSLKISPSELVRTQEAVYKKELKGKQFSDDEWIAIIAKNPKLLKRPVVISGKDAVIGDPPGNIDKIIN